jgi:peroxiredoxin
MPALESVYQQYRDLGFEILGVNSTIQDDSVKAESFAMQQGLTFPILLDTEGKVTTAYQVRALPTSFFVDADGIIEEVVVGGPMAEALLHIRINELMHGTSPEAP